VPRGRERDAALEIPPLFSQLKWPRSRGPWPCCPLPCVPGRHSGCSILGHAKRGSSWNSLPGP